MSNVVGEVYVEKKTAVSRLLTQIGEMMDVHATAQTKRPRDWNFVGDLNYVEERLREVRGFLLLGGEDNVADD